MRALRQQLMTTQRVPSPRGFRTSLPEGKQRDLLLLLLHGGKCTSEFHCETQPAIEAASRHGSLLQMAVATLDLDRSLLIRD